MAFVFPPPALLHSLGHLSRIRPARAFQRAAQDLRAAQTAHLAALLRENQGTRYGKQHGFAGILPEQYASRVPLMSPAALEPLVRAAMEGERGVLTAEAPVYYVRTTGSTGAPKHVPVTRGYVAEFQRTVHVSLYHLRAVCPEAFRGRALYFVGSRKVARAADGRDVGTMSGFNFTEMPRLVRRIYAWPYELFEVQDLKARGLLALLLAVARDVSLIAGIFPAPIVYLLRDLAAQAPLLARALRDGRLPDEVTHALSPAQRELFTGALGGKSPKLGARLDRAAAAPEEQRAAIALPALRLVYCWTTATAGLYVPELQRRVGPGVLVRDAIYSACEGWCSIPMGEERPGGALAVTSHYFEFIPEAQAESAFKAAAEGRPHEALRAWELQDGQRYLIVLTTAAGLYRYLLGDVVEVCGYYSSTQTPRIRFVRKHGASSNLAGEKLDEGHVNRAVGEALAAVGAEATFFTLVPEFAEGEASRPGYALLFEPSRGPLPPEVAERLRARVDAALGEASFDYGRLRAGAALRALRLVQLAPGSYDRVRQERVRDGSAEAQLKIAHLTSDASALAPQLKSALDGAHDASMASALNAAMDG
jgi:hypothetical protein